MRRHWSYLRYVLRHKWFVLVAGLKIGCPLWRLLVHDISKFRPSEWFPYAVTFYAKDGSKQYVESVAFNLAWLLHQHRNPHHWQHWVLRQDNPDRRYLIQDMGDWEGLTHIHDVKQPSAEAFVPDMDLRANRPDVDRMMRQLLRHANADAGLIPMRMPDKYLREMVADWMGAGRAITGRWETCEWYNKNRRGIVLEEVTRSLVEGLLNYKAYCPETPDNRLETEN